VQLRLLRRGHYPRGGGEAELTVCALPQGTTLPCWQLTTRGSLVRIDGRAHAAGRQRPDVAERMAAAAARTLRAALADAPDAILHGCTKWAGTGGSVAAGSTICSGAADSTGHVVVDVRVAPEAPERAISGDGGGITLVATTDSGMRLGASALAERGLSAEAVGELAAQRLVDTLHSGAAVDTW
jgi:RNA 3'-terminal phosphate cyclase (ATP)